MQYAQKLHERLEVFRNCSQEEISSLVTSVIPQECLPNHFLQDLSDEDRILCYRAIMISWGASQPTMVPTEMILRVVLADRHGKDALVQAERSYGYQLAIALCILLDDPAENSITITISPLKRIQAESDCNMYNIFGIPTVRIDKETPSGREWWDNHVYNPDTKGMGIARHLLVTPEQVQKSWPAWQLSKLGVLMQDRDEHGFYNKIKRINVEEAHSVQTVSIPKYTHPYARSPWGRLSEPKIILPRRVLWKAFSTTVPPHVLKTLENKILDQDFVPIRQPYYRPYTMYATHQVYGSIEKLRNYECFLKLPFSPEGQPRVLILVDNPFLASRIAEYLDERLPPECQNTGIIRQYHSVMSNAYIQKVYDSLFKEDGVCRIVVAVLGDSVSVDFPNIDIVCLAGLPPTMVDALQSATLLKLYGPSLFLIFYEKWAKEIDQDEYEDGDSSDPDRVRDVDDLSPGAPKRSDKAPLSAIQLVQSSECLRCFYADYLGEDSPQATLYAGPFCCDRHDDGFELQHWLPGPMYTGPKTRDVPAESA